MFLSLDLHKKKFHLNKLDNRCQRSYIYNLSKFKGKKNCCRYIKTISKLFF